LVARIKRRAFLRAGWGMLAAMAASGLGYYYALDLEPGWLEVTRHTIRLPRWPASLDGLTVAQISDVHTGPNVPIQSVRRAVQAVNRLSPDLVVLTGDFVSHSADYSAACAQELAGLRARYGLYAVLGNHDIWTDADQVAAHLARAGILVLRDASRPIVVAGTRLWLVGIEDSGYTGMSGIPIGELRARWRAITAEGTPRADWLGDSLAEFRALWGKQVAAAARLLREIPPLEPRLLLVHNPDFNEILPRLSIDLALCGHTHGGQVRLPFLGAPFIPSCMGQKYAGGLAQGPLSPVYVNRGLGVTNPPVRFLCRPEVTLLKLLREEAE
jgi:uncharacterized protein